ncbi:MAG: aspartate--tRNA(Asn) ligase [Planctomycetota bacterium]|nr:aspartate--tRNA(Asn) ligase [Planctomycetota bacterium]MEC9349802.1 aspartate--tRNA(Asn) ligase [Planctomycetota bacterium]
MRLAGWVHNLRNHKDVQFLVLRDRGGLIQAVAQPSSGVDLAELGKEHVVELTGTVVEEPRAPGGVEVHLSSVKVLSVAEEPPLEINRPRVLAKTHLDKILDNRPISLRAPEIRAVFEVQAVLVEAFGSYLRSQGFTEIKSSKLVGTGTEGGANVFEIDYFGRPAFLAQSPQFYKQIMVGSGLERVFEIGPVYRAEKHETSRHVNEYTSLDFEMGFIRDEQDIISMQIGLVGHMLAAARERCQAQLELLGATAPEVDGTIPQVTFKEAGEILEGEGHRCGKRGDLDPEGERLLCAWAEKEHGSDFLYVVGFPLSKRPMYTAFRDDDPETSRSFDLLWRGLEVTTGSQRIHDYALLCEKMKERGLDLAEYDYYVSAFRHGMPPHGGLGLGLERFTMQLLGLANVKQATLFPRDRRRISP